MRKWRVGTVSMGASLILLGCFLFISQVKGFEVFNTLIAWWPLILVILGLEVLCFVFFSKQAQPIVKYDIFSILFVGILGFISIGFVLLTATGIMGEVQHVVSAEEQTMELPVIKEKLPAGVERVVVETGGQAVSIEGGTARELHFFGTYRLVTSSDRDQQPLKNEDVLAVQTAGNTMYVTIKQLPQAIGLFNHYPAENLTLVLPQTVQVEVRGSADSIQLNPGELQNNWVVQNGANVTVNLSAGSDVALSALTHNKTLQGNAEWTTLQAVGTQEVESPEGDEVYETEDERYKGTIKIGKGEHHLDIMESSDLIVNVLN